MTEAEIIGTSAADSVTDAIFAIESACFGNEAWSRGSIRDFILNPNVITAAVHQNNDIVSFACALVICDEAEIMKVATLPQYQGHGHARRVLEKLIDKCKKSGVSRLLLEVRESNTPARSLYGSLGFTEYSRRYGYYTAPREDAVLMEKHI